jgi:hypothetical protein
MLIVLALAANAFHVSPIKNADLLLVTILLLSSVITCTLLTLKFGLLNTALISPLLDFPLALWVYHMWLKQRQQWKLIVIGGLISQLTLHASLIVMWKDGILTPELLSLYVAEINLILCIVLATLGGVGLINSTGKHE